jgi:hypothetical protein
VLRGPAKRVARSRWPSSIWKEGSLEIREAGGDHVVKPGRVFDTFLKGEDFHVNPKEAAILDRLHLPAVYGFVCLDVALQLGGLYCQFGSWPNSILHTRSLISAG